MADITNHLHTIAKESTGEGVRTAIINALNTMNTQGVNKTDKWEGHDISEFASKVDVNKLFNGEPVNLGGNNDYAPYDVVPSSGSKRAVVSQGIWAVVGGIAAILDDINGEEIPSNGNSGD